MIERRKKLCKCGCNQLGLYWKSGYLKGHHPSEKGFPKKKMSEKTINKIAENNNYYRKAIALNIVKNKGKCLCDECGVEILNPSGSNCSHVIGQGANPTLYHDIRNHFILCNNLKDKGKCEQLFSDEGKKHTMKIYPKYVEIKEQLNREYYER